MNRRRYIIILFVFCFCVPLYLIFFEYNKTIRKYVDDDYIISDELIYNINSFDYNDNVLSMEGWIVFPGDVQDVNKYNKHLWLISSDFEEIYTVDVGNVITTEPTKILNDGHDYLRSGFEVTIDLSCLESSCRYDIFICYTYKGMNLITDTNYTIN